MAAWAAVLFLFGTSNGMPPFTEGSRMFQALIGSSLNMAPDSVDDMYICCEQEMETRVKKFLFFEKNQSLKFKLAWRDAEFHYNTRWRNAATSLRKEEIMAIYAYTLNRPDLYVEFNDAVRTQRHEYTTTFAYHTLHFYLTMAIQSLRVLEPPSKRCLTSYRRTRIQYGQNIVNNVFRFGAFTSSSRWSYAAQYFGDETCFEIYTCFGADISKYSVFEYENEVLIPPYEVFEVTDVETRSAMNNLPCKVVYHVRSTGIPVSNLNCDLCPVSYVKSAK